MRGLSLVAASGGHSSSRCTGLSLSWPLLLRSTGSRRTGSAVVAHGPSCSAACGIFPDQGSNPCPLPWQADSQPLCHQGSPIFIYWPNILWLLYWLISSGNFNIDFLGFFNMYSYIAWGKKEFYFSLPTSVTFFLALLHCLGRSLQCWIKSVTVDILAFFQFLGENIQSFIIL